MAQMIKNLPIMQETRVSSLGEGNGNLLQYSQLDWNLPCISPTLSLCHSVVSDSVTLWTIVHQVPLSRGSFKQGYWSGLPFPSPGDLPYPWFEPASPVSLALQADSLLTESGFPDGPDS